MNIFNVRCRKVGGIWFLRVGRLQFSFCLCKSFAPREQDARSVQRRTRSRTHAPKSTAPLLEMRRYPAGSTVYVYDDR